MRYSGLNLLYHPFRIKLLAGLEKAKAEGIPLEIFETFRSNKRQSELWAIGRTAPGKKVTWTRPGKSYHNYGLAADLVLKIDGQWSWENIDLYKKAGPILEAEGLTWLGRNTNDLVHFQLDSGVVIEQLQEWYTQGGLENVWANLDRLKI